jgi:hypothetical protein
MLAHYNPRTDVFHMRYEDNKHRPPLAVTHFLQHPLWPREISNHFAGSDDKANKKKTHD